MSTTVKAVKPKPNGTTLSLVAEREHFTCCIFSSQPFKNSGRFGSTQEDGSKYNPFSKVQKTKKREGDRKELN